MRVWRDARLTVCLLSLLLACAGSFDEELSDPARRAGTAAAGASSGSASAPGATTSSAGAANATADSPAEDTMLASGAGGTGGATGSLPNPADRPAIPPIQFCDAPTKVLMASCGNGSCHSNENATIGDFAVSPEHAYNFVDRLSRRNPTCGRIIDSEDYSKSLLLTKVSGDFESPKCGERMPIGSFLITEEQIDCLASWLQQFQL